VLDAWPVMRAGRRAETVEQSHDAPGVVLLRKAA
jgi:hypothetical protein